jgi:hypothetical protein
MTQAGPVEPGVLGARLRMQQLIEDPQYGELEPLSLEARGALWPHAASWALIELTAVTESGARRLEEYRFIPGEAAADLRTAAAFVGPGLPVAVIFERTPNGASRARLYSAPGLRAAHPRSLVADAHLAPGRDTKDAASQLVAMMRAAEVQGALALFAANATLQEPTGALCQGRSAILAALRRQTLHGEDTPRYFTRLDEGPVSALELQLPTGWPCLLVCERDARGLLAALRLYR